MDDSLELLIVMVIWLTCGVINHAMSDKTYDDTSEDHWILLGAGYVFSPAITLWYFARALGIGVFTAIEVIFYADGRETWRRNRHQRELHKEQEKLEIQHVVNRRIILETEALELKERQAGLLRVE